MISFFSREIEFSHQHAQVQSPKKIYDQLLKNKCQNVHFEYI